MNTILDGLSGWTCLILVFVGAKEHDSNLRKVLQRLADTKVTLNKAKCEFNQTKKINYLGHIIDDDGVRADPEKTKSVGIWMFLNQYQKSEDS